MEPLLITEPELEEFWEVGASGRCYSREYVLDTLEERHSRPHEDPWETHGFHCRELASNVFLLTYTLVQDQRVSRRSTIWRRDDSGWKIVYHQGTLVEDRESIRANAGQSRTR